MLYVYVLSLIDNKYYITISDKYLTVKNINLIEKNEWTNKYKLINILEILENCTYEQVITITILYIKKYGINNVRNIYYPTIKVNDNFKKLINTKIFISEGKYLTNNSEKNNYKKIWFCDYCGQDFEKLCDIIEHEKTHKNGTIKNNFINESCCYLCF
tara:strand:+ start:3072 stop:3545 length:474 start_codon:yes stop_codon:yes gene_type:complete